MKMETEKASSKKRKPPFLQRFFRWAAAAAAAFSLCIGVAGAAAWKLSPDSLTVTGESGTHLQSQWYQVISQPQGMERQASATGSPREAQISLLGVVPVKSIPLEYSQEAPQVLVCGTPFGMKMEAEGVVVVGTADITGNGKSINPAKEAGLEIGDVIYRAGGKEVSENNELAQIFETSRGSPVTIEAERSGQEFTAVLTPVFSEIDGLYKGGLWVRDSTAGIGTLTFYDPDTGTFGGLGHGVCDVDTQELMPLGSGEILPVSISGIVKGQRGAAGELQGYFASDMAMGEMSANTDTGVYGVLFQPPEDAQLLPIAMKQEVRAGEAQILTTIDGGAPQYYDVEIEAVNYDESQKTKNLCLRVTDPELLKKTGGIVQGLSGSPIVQEGKLVGAVTNVLVNNPEKGYGIFAETMWECAQEEEISAKAS